jgi:hypothetical protein
MSRAYLVVPLLFSCICIAQEASKLAVPDAAEIKLGESAAKKFAELQGMAPTPGQQQ